MHANHGIVYRDKFSKEIDSTLLSRLASTPLFNTAATPSNWPFPQRTCSIDWPYIHAYIQTYNRWWKPLKRNAWFDNIARVNPTDSGCRKASSSRETSSRAAVKIPMSPATARSYNYIVIKRSGNDSQAIIGSIWISQIVIGTLNCFSNDSVAVLFVSRATSRGVFPSYLVHILFMEE